MKSTFLASAAVAALIAGSGIVAAQNSNEQRPSSSDVKSQSAPERPPQQTQRQDSSEGRAAERNQRQDTSSRENQSGGADKRPGEQSNQAPRSADRDGDQRQSTGQTSSEAEGQRDHRAQQQPSQPKDAQGQAQRDRGERSEERRTGQSGASSRQDQSGQPPQEQGRSSQQSPPQAPSTATTSNSTETRQKTIEQGRDVGVTLTAEQRTRVRETVLSRSDAPRVDNVNFSINVGIEVPDRVRVVEVPPTLIEIHPEWRGYSYFIVRDEIVIVDRSRKIVAVVAGGPSRAQAPAGSSVAIDLPPNEIKEIQLVLIERRFYDGEADGIWGPRTREALIKFQRERGFEATGRIDTRTVTELGLSGKIQVTGSGSGEATSGTQSASPRAGGGGSSASPQSGTTGQQPSYQGGTTDKQTGSASQNSSPSNDSESRNPRRSSAGEKHDSPQSETSSGLRAQ